MNEQKPTEQSAGQQYLHTDDGCDALEQYVHQSNYIEGEPPAEYAQITAMRQFLLLEKLTPGDVENIGRRFSHRCELRRHQGMDVRVGSYRPPRGGLIVSHALALIVSDANFPLEFPPTPEDTYRLHVRFESLHPFMDGNGRAGRALYLWQELRANRTHALLRGFLHHWYYESLSYMRLSEREAILDTV